MILLEQTPFMSGATVNQLLEVARIARPAPLRRDAVLCTETDAAASTTCSKEKFVSRRERPTWSPVRVPRLDLQKPLLASR